MTAEVLMLVVPSIGGVNGESVINNVAALLATIIGVPVAVYPIVAELVSLPSVSPAKAPAKS